MSIKAGHIFSSVKSKISNTAIETIANRYVDSVANRTKTAVTKAAKQLGQQAVLNWYEASNLSSGKLVASALRAESRFVRNQGDATIIRVTTYFDSSIINQLTPQYPKAEKWCMRHEDIDCDYTPGIFIFLLRWNTGALNLPEESTVSDWINDNYQVSPLGAMETYFSMYILSKLNVTTAALIRNRNRAMGAGTLSKNRGGLNNLARKK